MKNNDWKERLGMVYSTNPDFKFDVGEEEEVETLPKNQQRLRVRMEKNGRGGKTVTIVAGFVGGGVLMFFFSLSKSSFSLM